MVLSPLAAIREAFARRTYVVTKHATDQMLDRLISIEGVRAAMVHDRPEIIEDYPTDPRGASCLILCFDGADALHVQCTYPPTVYLVTAYNPDDRWLSDLRTRR
jgi:hypothetical protein